MVGTAIAAELLQSGENRVILIEQNEKLGMETTSRNSEVIHAGLYYPEDSLKSLLCLKGNQLIYDTLDPRDVPYSVCGKWIVAQTEEEAEYLEKLRDTAKSLYVPVSMISAKRAKKKFPHIRAEYGALESPSSGIISAHHLTSYLEASIENNDGIVATRTKLVKIEHEPSKYRYRVFCETKGENEPFEFTTNYLINSGGLHAPKISNMLLPKERHFKSYFAKGSYFTYAPEKPISRKKITTKLIYPCPNPNASSLGTHLTLDLAGQIRFGPDLEWVDELIQDPRDLNFDVSTKNLEAAEKAIKTYFPDIKLADLQPAYLGIRPKVMSRQENMEKFADFYIEEEEGYRGFINLIGIESPGLTSALAIALLVSHMVD